MKGLWHIEMFGGLRLRRNQTAPIGAVAETVVTRFRTRQTGALLAYLAYHPGAHDREVLIEIFWPAVARETGRNNLRVALAALRRQLEADDNPPTRLLLTDRRQVQLNPQNFHTDVASFEETLRLARQTIGQEDSSNRLKLLRHAVDLYKGPLLNGYYEDWISSEAFRLETQYFKALDELLELLTINGDWDASLHYARRGLQIDPQRASLQQALARLAENTAQGRVADQSSVSVSETSQSDGLCPIRVTGTSKKNTELISVPPSMLARFFGREAELNSIDRWRHEAMQGKGDATRLITLYGPGGVGKTHLALEAARRAWHDDLPVYFVALGDLSEASLLADAILNALPVERTPLPPVEQVVAALSHPCFLVLDNFEQLAFAGRALLLTLLQRLPSLMILLTSRQRLDLSGERLLEVGPLPIPPRGIELSTLINYPSVRMLRDRAGAVRPDFAINARNAEVVVRLLTHLEGLPLAIELAAARLGILSAARLVELIEQQETPLDVLATQRREVLPRHRSLRAVFQATFNLLPAEVRHFFAQLAPFRGGFDGPAASAVTGHKAALHFLSQLRSVSLLVDAGEVGSEMRFRLLEPLREFADEQLQQEGEHEEVQERHARYYEALSEQAARQLDGEQRLQWLERLNADRANLRAAFGWLLEHDPLTALRLAVNAATYQETRGYFHEGLNWLNSALASETGNDPLTRAKAHMSASRFNFLIGDMPVARVQSNAALTSARQSGEPHTLILVLAERIKILINQGEFAEAMQHGAELRALCNELGDLRRLAEASFTLALALSAMNDSQSLPLAEESVALFTQLADPLEISNAHDNRAYAHYACQDIEAARRDWQICLELSRAHNFVYVIYKALRQLAVLACRDEDVASADAALSEAEAILKQTDSTYMAAYFWEASAYLAIITGQFIVGAHLIGAAQTLREQIGHPLLPIFFSDHERFLAMARTVLGEGTLQQEIEVGRAFSIENADQLSHAVRAAL